MCVCVFVCVCIYIYISKHSVCMYIYIYIYICVNIICFKHKISKDIGSFAGPQITPIHCTSEGERVVVKDPRVQYEIYMGRHSWR